jgi:nicotinate-nucleotide pyrophosphorylase (carboxylating)
MEWSRTSTELHYRGDMMRHELLAFGLDDLVARALAEDLGGGDVTTESCIDPDARAVASAVARSTMVACGWQVFERVFRTVDANLVVERVAEDGVMVGENAVLWTVRGRARSILMGERVTLNFVQRMIGIATMARLYVDAVPTPAAGTTATRITDTRKTTPGLRLLERYAVRVGGAHNHRDNLGSAILIKDNHIAACGGVQPAIARARARSPHTSRIECEVDSLDQLDEALAAGADIVLLDNMNDEMVAEAVRRAKGRALTEASGGITLARIPTLARLGVDVISVGALTHSVKAADVGLDFA